MIVVSRALTAVVIAFAIVVVLLVVARIAYGISAPVRTLPGVILTTLVGALSLCCVAYALTTFVDSSESAQPVIQAITLPIFFISGVFFPEDIVPSWLLDVANIFPVRHLAVALLAAFGRTGFPATASPPPICEPRHLGCPRRHRGDAQVQLDAAVAPVRRTTSVTGEFW